MIWSVKIAEELDALLRGTKDPHLASSLHKLSLLRFTVVWFSCWKDTYQKPKKKNDITTKPCDIKSSKLWKVKIIKREKKVPKAHKNRKKCYWKTTKIMQQFRKHTLFLLYWSDWTKQFMSSVIRPELPDESLQLYNSVPHLGCLILIVRKWKTETKSPEMAVYGVIQ